MSNSLPFGERIQRLYARALWLYPERFRAVYGAQMELALRDALRDSGASRRDLILLIFRDFVTSLAKEHMAMLGETFGRPALIFNALVLAAISTVLALALYAIPQQVLRQGANDPQIGLAGDLVARLEAGVAATEAVPAGTVDMARSLTPFLIVYDDQGKAVASQAQLNGQTPVLPRGVLDFVRTHGEERVSWQPVPGSMHGVRIAAVVERVGGAHPGFVVAGRSLREVEAREAQVEEMAGAAWVGMLLLILAGTAGFGWVTRVRAA